jgi:hypothetical protein
MSSWRIYVHKLSGVFRPGAVAHPSSLEIQNAHCRIRENQQWADQHNGTYPRFKSPPTILGKDDETK